MSKDAGHHGGGVTLYWVFCAILCIVTFFEWLIFKYREDWNVSDTLLVVSLTVMSLTKFVMVVGWYMHLRYDPRLLKQVFVVAFLMITATASGLYVLMS